MEHFLYVHIEEVYTYDSDLGMLLEDTHLAAGKSFTNTYEYDWFGRLRTRTYPTGFEVQYKYTGNGHLKSVLGDGLILWSCMDANALGQITSYSQGSHSSTVTYNNYGQLTNIETGTIRKEAYAFDDMGNLASREDIISKQKEIFDYDDLNRLIEIEYYDDGIHQSSIDQLVGFDKCGNITSKSGVSDSIDYGEFAGQGPHALSRILNPDTSYIPPVQSIGYTCFDKVEFIEDSISGEDLIRMDFDYGLANQRIKTIRSDNGIAQQIKYFYGDYEEDSTSSGLKKYHYIYGGNGLTAIFVMQGQGNDTMFFCMPDHLGSLTTVVNATSAEVKHFSFDAWGVPRDANDWTKKHSGELFAGRGYTGHEHILAFQLINMNGRIYEPTLSRFFSPDPFVQLPNYPNNYNRYTYVLNNPLKYTDPTGYQTYFSPD